MSMAESDAIGGAGRVGPVGAVMAAWLLSLGFDLFLHAGLLARLYARPSPFLLPAEDAFRRIPLGYAAFLVLTVALFWLYRRLNVRGALNGFRMGLFAGLVLWGAWSLGLYSVSVAEADLLLGWWVGQGVELALAGAVLGAVAGGVSRRVLMLKVGGAWVLLVSAAILLQVAGLAPPMKVVGG
jgi:hypothetical protein